MTRMWLVPAARLCRTHLENEHKSLHSLVERLNTGRLKPVLAHARLGRIQTRSIIPRHTELVCEMHNRGWSHDSPLPRFKNLDLGEVNSKLSELDLFERCPTCRRRFEANGRIPQTPTIDERYQQVQRQMYRILHKFRIKYGGDYLELEAEARAGFAHAFSTYNPEFAFTTWNHHCVKNRLFAWLRKEGKFHGRKKDLDLSIMANKPDRLRCLLSGLSEDAKAIIQAGLDLSLKGRKAKEMLQNYLFDLGWAGARILEGFRELRQAIEI